MHCLFPHNADFDISLQSKFFIFTNNFCPYYAIKTIELMTSEAVFLEKVFHGNKFLAFES